MGVRPEQTAPSVLEAATAGHAGTHTHPATTAAGRVPWAGPRPGARATVRPATVLVDVAVGDRDPSGWRDGGVSRGGPPRLESGVPGPQSAGTGFSLHLPLTPSSS